MKEIKYKNRLSKRNHRKFISINEINDTQEAVTHVRKSFLYKVSKFKKNEAPEGIPEIFIKKNVDTVKQFEEFIFRTTGYFTVIHEGHSVKVEFSHGLRIQMQWKKKVFSPKKSVTLT